MGLEEQLQEMCSLYKKQMDAINRFTAANEAVFTEIEILLREKFPQRISEFQIYGVWDPPFEKVEIGIDMKGWKTLELREILWVEENTGFKYREGGPEGRYIFYYEPKIVKNIDVEFMEMTEKLIEIKKELKKDEE